MSTVVNPPRGMRDFLPEEKRSREQILAVIRGEFSRYGYQEIETPVVEELARLTCSEGGENEKLIFRILKRNLDAHSSLLGAADLGLRFDLTVPLARFYASNRTKLPEVFRCMQIGSVWRAERPQRGRFRQFTQCDLDVIGEPSMLAEIELITATLNTLGVLGLEGNCVRLNDRRLLLAMLEDCGFGASDHGRVLIAVDKLDKIGVAGVEQELEKMNYGRAQIEKLLEFLKEPQHIDGPIGDDVRAIFDAVSEIAGSSKVRIDATLVRGMGYYTGPIFEVEHPSSPSSIAGGGRYNGMIGRFANQDVPACGFSIGFERIVDLVASVNVGEQRSIALVYSEGVGATTLLKIQRELISEGFAVRLIRSPKKLGKLLEGLAQEGFSAFSLVKSSETVRRDIDVRGLQ